MKGTLGTLTVLAPPPPPPPPLPLARVPDARLVVLLAGALALWGVLYAIVRPVAEWTTASVLGLDPTASLGAAVAFFLYDAPKVLLLLTLVVFVIGVLRTFVTPEWSRRFLTGGRQLPRNVAAAAFGVTTPFCSCSAVPLFLGFVEAGVPLGVTLSFLIAAPMVNEVALVLLFGLFGWRIALLYLVSGLVIAVAAGWILGRMRMERFVEDWVYTTRGAALPGYAGRTGWGNRARRGVAAVGETVGKVWPYVLAGIAVGAAIHGWVPDGLLAAFMGDTAWWSVPLAVLAGVPMYAGASTIVPIVQALLDKGAALGTALAFMMAVIGLSLPEAIILRKVLRPTLIATFMGIVALGILAVGFLFNAVI